MMFTRRILAPTRNTIQQLPRPRPQHQCRKTFYINTRSMASAHQLSISKGHDAEAVTKAASTLLKEGGGKWDLCNDGKGVERQFKFKTFKATWDFMNAVAAECKSQKHHPEWTNIYNRTHVRWTTHNPEGLSTLDTHMAQFCDEAAELFGVQPNDPEQQPVEGGGKLVAGDCCRK